MYDALLLSRYADISTQLLGLDPTDSASSMRHIHTVFPGATHLDSTLISHSTAWMQVWYAGDAMLAPDPVMNYGAMWVLQGLIGAARVPMIYGDALFVGIEPHGLHSGAPRALREEDVAVLREVAAVVVTQSAVIV